MSFDVLPRTSQAAGRPAGGACFTCRASREMGQAGSALSQSSRFASRARLSALFRQSLAAAAKMLSWPSMRNTPLSLTAYAEAIPAASAVDDGADAGQDFGFALMTLRDAGEKPPVVCFRSAAEAYCRRNAGRRISFIMLLDARLPSHKVSLALNSWRDRR